MCLVWSLYNVSKLVNYDIILYPPFAIFAMDGHIWSELIVIPIGMAEIDRGIILCSHLFEIVARLFLWVLPVTGRSVLVAVLFGLPFLIAFSLI